MILFFGPLLLGFITNSQAQDGPVVSLPSGSVRGSQRTTDLGVTYYSFQKIPYATPPVGDLRFRPALPAQNWDGTLDVSNDLDVTCYRIGENDPQQSEDCLFINVFTPELPENSNDATIPVHMHIYGGSFETGDSRIGYGPDYFINEGVITVTFNFRSGAFGYLSTQDDVIPGNYGLKDQHLAIQWVYNNIQYFGGDQNKITLHGQSTGSSSALLQLLYPGNEGLINGVMGISASSIAVFALQRESRDLAFQIGRAIDASFNSTDSRDLLELLRATDAEILNLFNIPGRTGFHYGPVLEPESDEAFLTERMYQLYKNGDFIKVPIFLGFESEECLALTGYADVPTDDTLIPLDLDLLIDDEDLRQDLLQRINQFYTNGEGIKNNYTGSILYCSDNVIVRSIIRLAEITSNYVPVYLYRNDYYASYDQYLVVPGCDRVGHGGEDLFIWQAWWIPPYDQLPETDRIVHERAIRLFANFVKYGNPTPEPDELLDNIVWPTVNGGNEGDIMYLNINDNLTILANPKNEMYQFWKEIYETVDVDDLLDTY